MSDTPEGLEGIKAICTIYKYAIARAHHQERNAPRLAPGSAGATAPRQRQATWSAEHVRIFLDAIAGDSDEAFWLLVSTRVLRQGEARSLIWENWHREAAAMHVATSLTYWTTTCWQRTSTKST